MAITLAQRPVISAGDVDIAAIDYTNWLDSGETLTGTPTATEITTTHLTLSSVTVTTAAMTILNNSVSASKAVSFRISGQQAGEVYRVRVSAATSQTRTKKVDVIIRTAE